MQKSKANDAAVDSTDQGLNIGFGDNQDLRVIADKLLRLDHILKTNSDVCEALLQQLRLRLPNDGLHFENETDLKMNPYLVEAGLQRNRVRTLLKRMGSSSELVSRYFDIVEKL